MGRKHVLITVIVLIFVIGTFSFLNGAGKEREPEIIYILKNGQQVGEMTMDEVQALPAVEEEIVLNSSQGKEKHRFTGTPVKEVFLSVDSSLLAGAGKVIGKGIDGYTVAFNIKEVLEEETVLLVYAQDGKPLGGKSEGGTGPFRIIAPNDQFAQRAGKFIQELEVR